MRPLTCTAGPSAQSAQAEDRSTVREPSGCGLAVSHAVLLSQPSDEPPRADCLAHAIRRAASRLGPEVVVEGHHPMHVRIRQVELVGQRRRGTSMPTVLRARSRALAPSLMMYAAGLSASTSRIAWSADELHRVRCRGRLDATGHLRDALRRSSGELVAPVL